MTVCWLSAGVSSFVAGYLAKDKIEHYMYIDVADQHPDSMRFIKDCEKVLNKKIEILKSNQYNNVSETVKAFGGFRNVYNGFAPCTNWLKKRVRKEWEKNQSEHLTYVWGFDVEEKHRAERLVLGMPEQTHLFPLIESNVTKEGAHAICDRLVIKRPLMYDLGYNNNNCIGCIKGGKAYWNKIKKDFPEIFEKRAKLERLVEHSILKDCYLDELSEDAGKMSDEIMGDCDLFCQLAWENKQNDTTASN